MLQVVERKQGGHVTRPRHACPWLSTHRYWRLYRRAYERKQRQLEYRRLQAIVPSVAKKERVSKVTVIEEAIRYIDELQSAILQRFNVQLLAHNIPHNARLQPQPSDLVKLSPVVGGKSTDLTQTLANNVFRMQSARNVPRMQPSSAVINDEDDVSCHNQLHYYVHQRSLGNLSTDYQHPNSTSTDNNLTPTPTDNKFTDIPSLNLNSNTTSTSQLICTQMNMELSTESNIS